jgi:hypothetical protein
LSVRASNWTAGGPAFQRTSPEVQRGRCQQLQNLAWLARTALGGIDLTLASLDAPRALAPI